MTVAEFKKKWHRFQGKETSAYQSHFDDLCRLLGQQTPNEADPSGTDFFCFQKRVVKDAELFDIETPDASEPTERGFADVWKKGCFAWEYKGKKKNLDAAYKQLLQYREALFNPPLLVVCDFDKYIIRTNFNGTVQETHEFTNADIDRPETLRILRALFEDPDFLKPQRTTAQVTEELAETIAEVAKSLQKREAEELADAKTRKELNFAQRKNLRIARFLNRIVFCFFAEDTGLLPKNLFSDLLKTGVDDLKHFAKTLEILFRVMAKGGSFGKDKIRYFNGHLFEDSTVFEFTEDELRKLAEAGLADWQFIEPSIMGTLFERALEPEQRSQLGAHYTSETDIKTLVEPVLMSPLRKEWAAIKGELADAFAKGKGTAAQRERLQKFQKKLSAMTVLDPACGSGNFLYVSLQLLLSLEKEVITFATQLGFKLTPQVNVQQLRAIEINPYAFELAQVSVQIGYLQWRRDNGFENDRTPVLQVLDGFENKDALLRETFHKAPKNLKEARAEEHEPIVPIGTDQVEFQGAGEQKELGQKIRKSNPQMVKVYHERAWPEADIIISNPPFLGDKFMRGELSDDYVQQLRKIYGNRIPGQSDLCCYWFEKAREQIENGKCKRAGLLATQGIRGGANREVLNGIKNTGDIFFAESSREWILAGANVHVSMIGFDNGNEKSRTLDGKIVSGINANLTSGIEIGNVSELKENEGLSFQGPVRVGRFDIDFQTATEMLLQPNPRGKSNSDVLRPLANGMDLVKRTRSAFIIDFQSFPKETAADYVEPFSYVEKIVKPYREKNRDQQRRKNWWLHGRSGVEIRTAASQHNRLIATPQVAKHRIFVWLPSVTTPESTVIIFAFSDDFAFGVLHSRFHEIWSLKQGTRLETRPRYTPTTCFETFPFPRATPAQEKEIAAAAKELNELRERWLNPPEWTVEKILEFPGSIGGAWQRYINPKTVNAKTGVGTVRYPRLEPRDADCAAKLKDRTLTKLYNERPAWLDMAHKKLDAAVARAYGWNDFAQILEQSDVGKIYDFEDGGWMILDADAKGLAEAHKKFESDFAEKILERLLALNLERAAEETKSAKVKKPKAQRAKEAEEMI